MNRAWVPDIRLMAEQLVEDVRNAEMGTDPDRRSYGFFAAVGTFSSWERLAEENDEEITPDVYQALAILLAQMYVDK